MLTRRKPAGQRIERRKHTTILSLWNRIGWQRLAKPSPVVAIRPEAGCQSRYRSVSQGCRSISVGARSSRGEPAASVRWWRLLGSNARRHDWLLRSSSRTWHVQLPAVVSARESVRRCRQAGGGSTCGRVSHRFPQAGTVDSERTRLSSCSQRSRRVPTQPPGRSLTGFRYEVDVEFHPPLRAQPQCVGSGLTRSMVNRRRTEVPRPELMGK